MTKENNINNGKSFDAAQDKLKELELKCEEYLNGWKRERADFLNYKKDEIERIGFLGKYVKEDMILKILPILDNIYLAEKQLPENLKNSSTGSPQVVEWTKGFLQIQNQILDFLKKEGIEEIKTIGQKFDPNLMEATEEVRGGQSSAESGIVTEEIKKGYTMDGKVIRPTKVKISK
ncbi:MAG: nucleotide exchange factor GrpE [Patescibacteria group bacterium]